MKVWVVTIVDCESSNTVCICTTKEIALDKLFEERDKLVREWKELDNNTQKSIEKWCKENHKPAYIDKMYKRMIKNLSGNNYKKWNNYPHDCPRLHQQDLIGA